MKDPILLQKVQEKKMKEAIYKDHINDLFDKKMAKPAKDSNYSQNFG